MSSIWLAPAKLNLFLHVTGCREDGYHLLQTVFQFIGFYDKLRFTPRDDGNIHQAHSLPGINEEDDLSIKAAKLLQAATDTRVGADIHITKRIPTGAGLGGGSSNAATTLIALNQIWQTGLNRDELAQLGLKLGADVPVFIFGENAWAEGVGDILAPIKLEKSWFVVIIAPVHVSTAQIFSNLKLTRGDNPITIRDFLAGNGVNDLQEVTVKRYPSVGQTLAWLSGHGLARMTGTGAAVFLKVASEELAREIAQKCPESWQAIYARGLDKHPHI